MRSSLCLTQLHIKSWQPPTQSDLGLLADLHPLLLVHNYELGTAMDEPAQVVQEEVGLASPLLKLLADATILVRNRR